MVSISEIDKCLPRTFSLLANKTIYREFLNLLNVSDKRNTKKNTRSAYIPNKNDNNQNEEQQPEEEEELDPAKPNHQTLYATPLII